jgi:hypothetical protein
MAASLQGRLRANIRRGGGGGKARNTRAWERNLSITITQDQSSMVRLSFSSSGEQGFHHKHQLI